MTVAAPPAAEAEAKPAGPNDDVLAEAKGELDEARARMDADRAKQGLPPLTSDEFTARYMREMDERDNYKPIPMYYDPETDTYDPPDNCSPPLSEDERSPRPGGTLPDPPEGPPRPGGPTRDLVWGVLLFAAIVTGRSGPAAPADASSASALVAPEGRP